jgi:outer membrane protein OmpA-like peptidoglycan-associated protein
MKQLLFISFLLFSVSGYGQVYNLAKNGDFEDHIPGEKDSIVNGELGKEPYQFWTYLDENGARYRITSDANKNVTGILENPVNTNGKYIVYTSLGDDYYPENKTLWHQKVKVSPNTTYLFSCRVANICCNRTNTPGNVISSSTQPSLVRLAVNGIKITKTKSLNENSGWMLLEAEYLTKPGEKEINIEIQNLMNVYEGNDVAIDDIFFGLPENKGKKNPKSENTSEDDGGNFQVGQYFDLNSVNFEIGKSDLPKSKPAVDNLAGFMKKYKTTGIRLEGHTEDLKGINGEKLNKDLSLNRVQAIKDYLVSQGIEAGRIEVLGLGQSMRFEKKESDPSNRILAIITKK